MQTNWAKWWPVGAGNFDAAKGNFNSPCCGKLWKQDAKKALPHVVGYILAIMLAARFTPKATTKPKQGIREH